MTTNHKLRVLCEELLVKLAEYDSADPYHDCKDLIDRARNALADNSSPKLLRLDDAIPNPHTTSNEQQH